jgi:hypothetical protein
MHTPVEYAKIKMFILYGSASAMHARMQENIQYVFHIQTLTYFYGCWIVLETLCTWCLQDKKLVVLREKLERQRLKMLFFSPLMTTVEEVYLKNYIYREPINTLEELNDRIHDALATVIPNMLRLTRKNLIKRARLFLQMEGGHFEYLLLIILFILHVSYFISCILRLSYKIWS